MQETDINEHYLAAVLPSSIQWQHRSCSIFLSPICHQTTLCKTYSVFVINLLLNSATR